MEAASSPEMSLSTYEPTWRHNPKYYNLRDTRRKTITTCFSQLV
jgi:hypothetical protein